MTRTLRAAFAAGLALAVGLPPAPLTAASKKRQKSPKQASAPSTKPPKPAPVPEAKPPREKRRRAPAGPPVIRRIRVVRRDIFDTRIPTEDKKLFRAVNALHVSTKERAIREQLLLKEGARYNADLAKESERAIRGILRLRNVKVTPIPIKAGVVDLLVSTQETWTTEPVLSASGVGSNLNLKAGIRERNLMGYGKNASYFYRKTDGVISRTFSYDDPHFLGTPLDFSGDHQERDDGTTRSVAVTKPFSSTITRWSASASYLDDKREVKELDNLGKELDLLFSEGRSFGGDVALSAGSTTRKVRRPLAGYTRQQGRLTRASTGVREADDLYHIFRLGYTQERVNFLVVNHIKQYDRDEDYNLGPAWSFSAGASRKKWVPTAQNANFFNGKYQAGRRHGPSHFGFMTFDGTGKFEDERWRSSRAGIDFEYYNHFQPRQTLACHLGWAAIVNPGPSDQLLLGGDTGLRGYKLNQFAGNKKLLVNVEDRFFLVDDVLRFMSLGAAVFADAGTVWAAGKDMRLKDVKADVGAGLRLYLTRTSLGHVLRFDLAYALKRAGDQERLVFTFGTSHAF